jgi:Protein of unknown function (DUF3750)
MKKRRPMQTLLLVIAVILALGWLAGARAPDWRVASREPVGLAPDPATTPEAVVQVYAARVIGWRGYFGVHSWVAVKPAGAPSYTVYEVIGWRLRYGNSALVIRSRGPDERWFGALPELLAERRGPDAEALVARVDEAARAYPYAGEYGLWPGPNSNTFTAWIARAVPELRIDLPPTAIGKDYLRDRVFATAPSGSGFQVSLMGLLGFTASGVEGLEVNVLGLTFGFHPYRPSIRLPVVGRFGLAAKIVSKQ